MARPKIPRKSTSIDMTAMCDVAFLLLSFFILTAKPKSNEAVMVTPPHSVSKIKAPEKDVVLVSINKDGKVFLSIEDKERKSQIVSFLNSTKNAGLTEASFDKLEFIGVPFASLNKATTLPSEQLNEQFLPGIPVDSTKGANELIEWMDLVNRSGSKKPNLLLKGDNLSKYPAFKSVITAFKKHDFLKFQIVTDPESVPTGTDLWKQREAGGED